MNNSVLSSEEKKSEFSYISQDYPDDVMPQIQAKRQSESVNPQRSFTNARVSRVAKADRVRNTLKNLL